jgi:predicted Co/Zn/Cd cation transporter (cation efflux family)
MHYLSQVSDVRDKRALIKGHLWRLGVVAGLGWLLGVVALSVQITFDFIWALALGLLVITSLSGVIRYLRRESEQN